jgi:hypothetical protein
MNPAGHFSGTPRSLRQAPPVRENCIASANVLQGAAKLEFGTRAFSPH